NQTSFFFLQRLETFHGPNDVKKKTYHRQLKKKTHHRQLKKKIHHRQLKKKTHHLCYKGMLSLVQILSISEPWFFDLEFWDEF
ncbi:unnamed protein product, partial [Prunus brigantina]